jgi:hypothetical protein
MVEPQALQLALGDQATDQAMRIAEHRRHLLAQADEVVDVEEAAIVDLVGCDAPERQAIGLALEQLMQRAEALGRAGPAVERFEFGLDSVDGYRLIESRLPTASYRYVTVSLDGSTTPTRRPSAS